MRPVAVGRKKWLQVGSARSGTKVSAILSVVEYCRRLGMLVKQYQLAVLPGTTHVMLVERAAWLTSMVTEFLDTPMGDDIL